MSVEPVVADACPLCGGGNGCVMASGGGPEAGPCWCTAAVFPASLLARIPAAQRGVACVCAACASAAAATRGAS